VMFVNRSPGVDYVFYVDLVVICVCYAENIENGCVMDLILFYTSCRAFLYSELPHF
jgi:hypothetical protein